VAAEVIMEVAAVLAALEKLPHQLLWAFLIQLLLEAGAVKMLLVQIVHLQQHQQ
jgi:hypothetical protein